MRAASVDVVLAAVTALSALLPAALPAQETHVLLVVGLGGTEEYRATFHGWATDLREAALERHGLPAANVVYLGEDPERAPGMIRSRSTRENLEAAVREMAERAAPDDRILVVLLGHGTSRSGEARFNLPGPDLGPGDVATLLEAFPSQTVALVNTAPASGPFVEAVSGPRRVVLTATRTARERNETRFGEFFTAAFGEDGADLDKDGRISLLEAFRYARAEVERHYEEENLLLTEHAVLDDNGDGEGSAEPGPDAGDGALARSFWLGARSGVAAIDEAAVPEDVTDPELRKLYEEKAALEDSVAALRARKSEMEEEAYQTRLEELLLELALKNREIREHRGGGS